MPRFPKAKDYPFLGMSPYNWYRFLVFIETRLPEPLLYFIARRVVDIRRLMDKPGREAIKHNLRLILGNDVPKRKIKRLVKDVYYETATYLAEFLGQKRFAPKWLAGKGWDTENLEYLEEPLAEGRGALLISAHYSNWEVGAALLAALGLQVHVTSLEHEDPRITALFNRLRSVWGYVHMPINESVKRTMAALRQGKVVSYLGDRTFGAAGVVEVEFFGRKVQFPNTPAHMALRTGAAYVPGFVRREGRNTFHLQFAPEIRPLSGADEKENVKHLVQEYAHILEGKIREYPSQWIRYTPIDEEAVE